MRIISQKGIPVITDIPYEKVAVSQAMTEPNKIIAWDVSAGENNLIFMAQYSTQEKSEKAMQMLHEAYAGAPFIVNNVEVPEDFDEQLKNMKSGFITVVDHGDNVRIEPMNIVFRFPSEDDI